jgi:hypothetical protein
MLSMTWDIACVALLLVLGALMMVGINALSSRRYRQRRIAKMIASGDPKYNWLRD